MQYFALWIERPKIHDQMANYTIEELESVRAQLEKVQNHALYKENEKYIGNLPR